MRHKTPLIQLLTAWLVVAALAAPAWVTAAQPYPAKPVRIVVGFTPGTTTDITARALAQALTPRFGQQVIVENREGANSGIANSIVARANPDGHTILIGTLSLVVSPLLYKELPFDPKDLAPVSLVVLTQNVICVNPKVEATSIRELIALARSRPGELNYASGATGGTPHLAAELFKSMAKVNIVRITYKGSGQALTDMLAGHLQVSFPNAGGAASYISSGRLRALAVTAAHPSALFPKLPTVSASGLPGYEAGVLNGIFVPARTPAAVVRRLNQEIVLALSRPDVKDKLFTTGVEAVGSPPERLTEAMKADMTVWGKLIRELGIRNE